MANDKLSWKRVKLTNPEWIEEIAACAVGGEYQILGTGNEYVVGYRAPKARRGSSVKVGTATNVPEAMKMAQADNDQRLLRNHRSTT